MEHSSSRDLPSLALFTSLARITITTSARSDGEERDGADDRGDELQSDVSGTGHGRTRRKPAESGVTI